MVKKVVRPARISVEKRECGISFSCTPSALGYLGEDSATHMAGALESEEPPKGGSGEPMVDFAQQTVEIAHDGWKTCLSPERGLAVAMTRDDKEKRRHGRCIGGDPGGLMRNEKRLLHRLADLQNCSLASPTCQVSVVVSRGVTNANTASLVGYSRVGLDRPMDRQGRQLQDGLQAGTAKSCVVAEPETRYRQMGGPERPAPLKTRRHSRASVGARYLAGRASDSWLGLGESPPPAHRRLRPSASIVRRWRLMGRLCSEWNGQAAPLGAPTALEGGRVDDVRLHGAPTLENST